MYKIMIKIIIHIKYYHLHRLYSKLQYILVIFFIANKQVVTSHVNKPGFELSRAQLYLIKIKQKRKFITSKLQFNAYFRH